MPHVCEARVVKDSSACRVIALPRGTDLAKGPQTMKGRVVFPVREAGTTPQQPANGMALANVPGVVVVGVGKKFRWAILSQLTTDTVYAFSGSGTASLDTAKEAAMEYIDTVGDDGDGPVISTSTVIGNTHDSEVSELALRHEYNGLVTDLIMSLSSGQPLHHSRNEMVLKRDGSAESTYTYHVPKGKKTLIDLRSRAVACLMRSMARPQPSL